MGRFILREVLMLKKTLVCARELVKKVELLVSTNLCGQVFAPVH